LEKPYRAGLIAWCGFARTWLAQMRKKKRTIFRDISKIKIQVGLKQRTWREKDFGGDKGQRWRKVMGLRDNLFGNITQVTGKSVPL
jgi:hypothetical protein